MIARIISDLLLGAAGGALVTLLLVRSNLTPEFANRSRYVIWAGVAVLLVTAVLLNR